LIRQAFDGISPRNNVHERNSRNFSYSPPELTVTGCDDVALVCRYTLHKAVVSICAVVAALEAFESRVTSHPESYPISVAQLLELRHHAIRHARYAFGIEAIHHAADKFQLILKAEIDEVGVDKHAVRWHEFGVVRKKERRCNLRYATDGFRLLFFFLFLLLQLVLLQTGIIRAQ